ncbi:MAG: PilZ domain-containing protein [Chitinophagales bacterium]
MKSLVGRAVMVCLSEENPPVRLEGRVSDQREALLEVRLARREMASLRSVLRRTIRLELEYVEGREVYAIPCNLETYGTAFPPALIARPTGAPRLISRRRHERFATNLPLRVVVDEADGTTAPEKWAEGRLVNLSQGGAAISLPGLLHRGTTVTLQFVAREMVRPRGKIIRVEEGDGCKLFGVEFLTLSTHDQTCLSNYLSSLGTSEAAAARD